jgi:hypothetical protein
MSGQMDGRDDRVAKSAQWLNAVAVLGDGQPMINTEDDVVDPELVGVEVETIRVALSSGVSQVECFIISPAMVEAIRSELSRSELEKVVFLGDAGA